MFPPFLEKNYPLKELNNDDRINWQEDDKLRSNRRIPVWHAKEKAFRPKRGGDI